MVDQRRFTRGGVYPIGWPEGSPRMLLECPIAGEDPTVEVTVGFLQLIEHRVLDRRDEPVSELVVDGVGHRDRLETIEREVTIPELPGRTASIAIAASGCDELLESGAPAGRLRWRRETLHGTVEAWLERLGPELRQVRVSVANRLEWDGGGFEETLLHTLCSTRVTLRSPDGSFVGGAELATSSPS